MNQVEKEVLGRYTQHLPTSSSLSSHLQQTRRRDGHAVRCGHHLLAQLPRHVLHYRPLVENARLEVKIPEMSLDPRADTIRQSAVQRVLRNFLRIPIDIGVNLYWGRPPRMCAHVCCDLQPPAAKNVAQLSHACGLGLYFSTCLLSREKLIPAALNSSSLHKTRGS